eukprot:scaffold2428_cov412-Prasinococcus_capsulatus_cf.AAC.11
MAPATLTVPPTELRASAGPGARPHQNRGHRCCCRLDHDEPRAAAKAPARCLCRGRPDAEPRPPAAWRQGLWSRPFGRLRRPSQPRLRWLPLRAGRLACEHIVGEWSL